MDEVTASSLQKAYALIKAGNKLEAANLLIPIVRADPNLAEAWFLLGHAVVEPNKRIQCFQQVLRLNPAHAAAKRQLEKLQTSQPAPVLTPRVEPRPKREIPVAAAVLG